MPVNLGEIADRFVSKGHVPGAAAILAVHGQETHAYRGSASLDSAAPLNAESRFHTSCMMKFFVSLVALALAKDGLLDIEAPLGRYLDDLSAAAPRKSETIKLRHLLSHSSGYIGLDINSARVKWGYSWPKFIEFFRDTPQLFQPGTIFSYEHSEHVVLGEIIARVTGEAVADIVAREIFEPLEIQSRPRNGSSIENVTGYKKSGAVGSFSKLSNPSPCRFWEASIPATTMTLCDMVKIGQALLDCSIPRFSKDLADMLVTPVVPIPRMQPNMWSELTPDSFGLVCGQYPRGIVGLNGSYSGQTCALRLIPSQGVVMAVAINAWAPDVRDAMAADIADLALGRSSPRETGPSRQDLAALLGPFSTKDVTGTYLGAFHGEISVESFEGLPIAHINTAEGRQTLFQVRRLGDYKYQLFSEFPISAAFFPDPADNEPCIAVGVHCYKKVRD